MFDAEEARKLALDTRRESLEAIYSAIREESEKGKLDLDIGLNCINDTQVEILRDLGYDLTPTPNNCGYIIDWSESC